MRTVMATGNEVERRATARALEAAGYKHAGIDIGEPRVHRALVTLDVDDFVAFLTDIGGSPPVSRHAVLAMMHKIRAQYRFHKSFTDGQQRISKRWLKDHGFTNKLHDEKMDLVQDDA